MGIAKVVFVSVMQGPLVFAGLVILVLGQTMYAQTRAGKAKVVKKPVQTAEDRWIDFPKQGKNAQVNETYFYNPSKVVRDGQIIKFWLKSIPRTAADAKAKFLSRHPAGERAFPYLKDVDFSKFLYTMGLIYLNCKARTIGHGKQVDYWNMPTNGDSVTFKGEIEITIPTVLHFKPTMTDVTPGALGEHWLETICSLR